MEQSPIFRTPQHVIAAGYQSPYHTPSYITHESPVHHQSPVHIQQHHTASLPPAVYTTHFNNNLNATTIGGGGGGGQYTLVNSNQGRINSLCKKYKNS